MGTGSVAAVGRTRAVGAGTAAPVATGTAPGGVVAEGRSARKRQAIMEAATELFLRQGYRETSMDEVAASAAVSKQTVYKHFADKQNLFSDIVIGITERVDELVTELASELAAARAETLGEDLRALARRHLAAVMQPQVLRLRRLVIAEAGRFPDLARSYYERAPGRVVATLASGIEGLAERGLLRLDDPSLAANHLAYLILSIPLDRALFYGDDSTSSAELDRCAEEAVRVFLAAYGRP
jgi:TetR/AcrR family transcriptional repressor of mexJK operon